MATFSEAPQGYSNAGEKIFKTKCAQCHTVEQGAGRKQGTTLSISLSLSHSHRSAFSSLYFIHLSSSD